VKPKGAVDVTLQVGQGAPFQETVLVVSHLPGDVQALVSFDTARKVGLVLGPDHVSVGGEVVVPLAASERAGTDVGEVEVAKEMNESASTADWMGEEKSLSRGERVDVAAEKWAASEAAKQSKLWEQLRERPERLGTTKKTFAQLEKQGAVMEVFQGPDDEPVCRIDPARLEPWWTGRARGPPRVVGKSITTGEKKSVKATKKTKKNNKRRERAEQEARDFEAVAEELEAMAAEREWKEELARADQARAVAAAATMQLQGQLLGARSQSSATADEGAAGRKETPSGQQTAKEASW
jgi:hypothetical protein